jgi:predicted TIM-barrel enzyme
MSQLLKEVKDLDINGVQNFPTVGLIDGVFRQNLEEIGMNYEEVEMIKLAHEFDLLTTPYVFNVNEAERMTRAGADVIVAHTGLATNGTIGAQTMLTLDDSVIRVRDFGCGCEDEPRNHSSLPWRTHCYPVRCKICQ